MDGKNKTKKPSETQLLKDWASLVKQRAGNKCEYCGKREYLNSHHIYSRSKKSVRYDEDNGVCLCVAHHTFSSAFSAHKTPLEFIEWLKDKRGQSWYDNLRITANAIVKHMDTESVATYLRKELKSYS